MQECQARVIRDTLERTNGNVSEAARLLDVTRGYLHELIKVHDIKVERK